MSELKIFSSQRFGEIRAAEIDGEPWFCLADICKPLGLKPSKCKERLKPDGVRHRDLTDSMGRPTKMLFVNEPNLYRTIFQSTRPEATPFVDWVTEDVLPKLRKTGTYSLQKQEPVKQAVFPEGVSLSGMANLIRITRRVMLDIGNTPEDVGVMVKEMFEAVNFPVPSTLSKQLPGQMDLFERAGLEAAQ